MDEICLFTFLPSDPLGDCLFGLSPQGGYRARFLGLFYGKTT